MSLRVPFYPTEHELRIFSQFPEVTEEPPIPRSIVCCFVNRTGSNYLCDLLASTGLIGRLEEIFDWEHIRTRDRSIPKSLSAYVRSEYDVAIAGNGEGRLWGFKASWSQLLLLKQTGIVPGLLTPCFFEVRRRDKIGQAISYYVALTTGNWSDTPSAEAPYDGQKIYECFEYVLRSEMLIETAMTLLGSNRRILYYEDIVADPFGAFGAICSDLGLGYSMPDLAHVTRPIQRRSSNVTLRQRFLRDLGAAEVEWIR